MIKPVNISTIGIEPIKVPHQNNTSFTGIASAAKKVSNKVDVSGFSKKIVEKVAPLYKKCRPAVENGFKKVTNFVKKVPEYIKNAGEFIAKKANQLKEYIVGSAKDFADATKNPAKKSRTLRKLAIALGATAGAGGITKKAINNKKDSK